MRFFHYLLGTRPFQGTYYTDSYSQYEIVLTPEHIGKKTVNVEGSIYTFREFWVCYTATKKVFI